MRIAIGGIVHETNTYAVASFGTTSLDVFDAHRSAEILRHRGSRTFTGGRGVEADHTRRTAAAAGTDGHDRLLARR